MAKQSQKLSLMEAYQAVRQNTNVLCQPLAIEDYVVQSVIDVSPPKWHLAHTTWFFETFLLLTHAPTYQVFHPQFHYLFNSYYHGIGEPFPRHQRGLLSRPTVETVYAYRTYVDNCVVDLINQADEELLLKLQSLITLGIHHEHQHQELLLMDIKHNFYQDPDFPIYQEPSQSETLALTKLEFQDINGGLVEIGHNGEGFCFDNELPRHKKFLNPYRIAKRLVSNQEYCEFIEDGGYAHPRWWLSDGWDCVQSNRWQSPLYWKKINDQWYIFSLSGLKKLNPAEPASHMSYFEADAYARWKSCRLPSEEEWEHCVLSKKITRNSANFMEKSIYHPQASLSNSKRPQQFFGDLWEWTSSSYTPYQGFKPFAGALGEYNGKFMNNQRVLRGGCCATPEAHIRASYRNFYQPDKRWQFSGIRLAADA